MATEQDECALRNFFTPWLAFVPHAVSAVKKKGYAEAAVATRNVSKQVQTIRQKTTA